MIANHFARSDYAHVDNSPFATNTDAAGCSDIDQAAGR